MTFKAKCLFVQRYLGNLCVDSGEKTTDEKRAVVRVVDGRAMDVLEPVSPSGPGHAIFVNKEQTMYRVNFAFQDIPLVGDLTLVGITEEKYVEGEEYNLEINI